MGAAQGDTKTIILIRHGQYHNKGGPSYGLLTEKGREQAKMAGQHLVARFRADPTLKHALRGMTSSAVDRAIETADIIEQELLAELEWVDVERSALPDTLPLRLVDTQAGDSFFIVGFVEEARTLNWPKNPVQSAARLRSGSRLRISNANPPATTLGEVCSTESRVSVHQPLPARRAAPLGRFNEWECDGCKKELPDGDIHWSDDAEKNGLGFCDACFAAGPKHRRLKEGDTCSRKTEGVSRPLLRRPNDPNLNEADVDTVAGLTPNDVFWDDYGVVNAQIFRDKAQVEAAFRKHFHRTVDHKSLRREARQDVWECVFLSAVGKEHKAHLSKKEFEALELKDDGSCSWIWDPKVKTKVEGSFSLQRFGTESVEGKSLKEIKKVVSAAKQPTPGKQIEILVVHQNIIRWLFLRGMQFDTTMWLNFGGSNCTMTQMRINRRGDVICDFFADHGSVLPVRDYTFNNHPDV